MNRTEPLPKRKMQILRLLVEGKEDHEIADELHLSPDTVKSHVKSLFRMLGVRNRAGAVGIAYKRDLLALHADTEEEEEEEAVEEEAA